jgi:hypothetical protein
VRLAGPDPVDVVTQENINGEKAQDHSNRVFPATVHGSLHDL